MKNRIITQMKEAKLTLWLLLICNELLGAQNGEGRLVEQDLIRVWVSAWGQVRQFYCEYNAVPVGRWGRSSQKIMAVSSTGEVYHYSAHLVPGANIQDDPFAQELFISNDIACHRWPFTRIFNTQSLNVGQIIPGSLSSDVLLALLPVWPNERYKMRSDSRSGQPVLLCGVLMGKDVRLKPSDERIIGEECVLAEVGKLDRIWLAEHKPLCLLRWEKYSVNGGLVQVIATRSIQQVAGGLWLPKQVRVTIFGGEAGTVNVVKIINDVEITGFKVNDDVASDIYTPVHRAGSIAYDSLNGIRQVVPGGEDVADKIAAFVAVQTRNPLQPRSKTRRIVWMLAGGMAGAAALFLVFPKSARKKEG